MRPDYPSIRPFIHPSIHLQVTVLLCDAFGLQVRSMIEVAVDTYGLSTRFRAEHSMIANPAQVCTSSHP